MCLTCERGKAERAAFKQRHETYFVDEWLAKSGIPPRSRRLTFDTFPNQSAPSLKAVRTFVADWKWDRSLLLTGRYGVGKTGLLAGAVHEIAKQSFGWQHEDAATLSHMDIYARRTCKFISTSALFDDLRAGYDDHTFAHTMDACQRVDLLILDDLGAEKPTEWVRERLFAIINDRYEHERPIWATSNLTLEALEQAAGERVVWRLLETSDVIALTGPNLRERAA